MTLSVDARLDLFSQCFCVPVSIILTYSLFQYLVTVFYSRRRDPHVRLLLVVSFLSFAVLIPFAYPDEDQIRNLNDMSEVCSILTFTQQIAMLARGVNKKMKLQALAVLGKIAELLVLIGLVLLISNVIHLGTPTASGMSAIEVMDDVIEYAAILFVVCFRFYFLSVVRGWRHIIQNQKLEIFYYLLFLTHAVAFHALESALDLDLFHVKGLWMRITIALCLSPTIRAKVSALSSLTKSKATTSVAGGRPRPATFTRHAVSMVNDTSVANDEDESSGELLEGVGPGKSKLKDGKNTKKDAGSVRPADTTEKRGPRSLMRQLTGGKNGVIVRLPSATGSLRRRFSRSGRSSTRVTAMPTSPPTSSWAN